MRKALATPLVIVAVAVTLAMPVATPAGAGSDCAVVTPHTIYRYELYDVDFGQAGSVIWRLYMATFLRQPEERGFDHWVGEIARGSGIGDIAYVFVNDDEFQNRYGNLDNSQFVSLVYRNVLCRDPDTAGSNYWVGRLDSGEVTREFMMVYFAESREYLRKTETCHALYDDLNSQLPRCMTYATCDDMRAAGYSEVIYGDLLYSVNLDDDKNFVACQDDWHFDDVVDLVPGQRVHNHDLDYFVTKVVASVTAIGDGDYRVAYTDGGSEIAADWEHFWIWSSRDD